ncbi:hypothetical protein ACHAW5_003978 [Stephanodiscus triporus]|uniref:Alcohol dehydrogenase-like C-terminal domain-containing protein n=1 Tax=Stephanodiscus triporus TaxID=2934178 RepID=A0ABD3QR69_9STRA
MKREKRINVPMLMATHQKVDILLSLHCAPKERLFPSILGHVWNTCKVEPNSSVAVFGLRAFGLVVIQGARMASASRIIGVDINPEKFPSAVVLGATNTVDSSKLDVPIQSHIAGKMTPWGVDYSFDCTGNVNVSARRSSAPIGGGVPRASLALPPLDTRFASVPSSLSWDTCGRAQRSGGSSQGLMFRS